MERLQQILVKAGYDIGKTGLDKDGVDGDFGNKSRAALTKYLIQRYKMHGYLLPSNKAGNGLTWLRMNDEFTDKFSDFVAAWNNNEVVSATVATTKAGKYYVYNPVTVGGITGTGVQKEGQTLASHKFHSIGKSKWGSSAGWFEQIKPIYVYRDGNKNNKLDKNVIQFAPTWYGFFFHAMGKGFSIWNWSAGCMGCPRLEWEKYIDPWFNDGDIIDQTIIEVY